MQGEEMQMGGSSCLPGDKLICGMESRLQPEEAAAGLGGPPGDEEQ